MNRPFSALLAIVVLAFSVDASAFAACGEHFPSGNAPVVSDTHLRVQVLCYERFVVLHSGLTNGPLLVAEHLVAHHVRSAKGQIRVNLFHPEPRLNPPERAELSDFARSGYDRGHMAPSGDMPDANSQAESFTLANMVPQDAQNNRYLWEAIESATRAYVQRAGEAIVMTGPFFWVNESNRLAPGFWCRRTFSRWCTTKVAGPRRSFSRRTIQAKATP